MRTYLETTLRHVLATLAAERAAHVPAGFEPELETPNDPAHGDLSTNTALRLAGAFKAPPRRIAEDLAERLRAAVDPRRIAAVEVAGPGFINFRFAEAHLTRGPAEILAAGDAYGRTDAGAGQTALVEYVSANPTGPLTVGHGRNAVLGDTIANLLAWSGYEVTREYYFNDAGRQMRVLAQSVQAWYRLLADPERPTRHVEVGGETKHVPADLPEDGYLGAYITDIARTLYDAHGEALLGGEDLAPFKEAAEEAIFADIEATLQRLGIEMDTFFNEHVLYEDGSIAHVLETLRAEGTVYDKDGATWFKTTAFGKEQDTVLVKSTGEPTYRLPDIAYHVRKFERGFDAIVDIFGADHIATYPDVLSGLEVLGYDARKVDVVIYQFVTLVSGGAPVKMSTRKATYVTLDELMDEVGEDVARFFFLMRSPNTHLDFDLDLAREASDKNPVFYLQYAHARICSIMDKAEEVGLSTGGEADLDEADLSLLAHEAEEALVKELLRWPGTLARAAEARAPHRVAGYLRDVATQFNQFYRDCRILGEAEALATARLRLARAAQVVLRNGLAVLGVSAPRQM